MLYPDSPAAGAKFQSTSIRGKSSLEWLLFCYHGYMKNSTNQGSALIVIVIILSVAILGALGYVFWSSYTSERASQNSSSAQDDDETEQVDANEGYILVVEWQVKVRLGDNADKVSYSIENRTGNLMGEFMYDSVLTPKIRAEYLSDTSCGIGLSMARGSSAPENFLYKQIGEYYYVITGSPYLCESQSDAEIISPLIRTFSVENVEPL